MHEKHLRGVDLNLLPLLDALLTERSVGRAAVVSHLSQPAMSRALGRLRALLDDPLLLRTGGETRLTPRAAALAGPVRALLAEVRATIAPATFDPAAWRGRVAIAATDHQALTLLPTLTSRLRRRAPGLDLDVRPMNAAALEALRRGDVQLGFGLAGPDRPSARQRPLYRDRFVTLLRRDHPAATAPLTVERFAALDHIIVSVLDDTPGAVDAALAAQGLRRRIAVRQPHFTAALAICAATDLATTLPASVADRFAESYGLVRRPVPVAGEPFTIALYWSAAFGSDPAQAWLRDEVVAAARDAGLEPG